MVAIYPLLESCSENIGKQAIDRVRSDSKKQRKHQFQSRSQWIGPTNDVELQPIIRHHSYIGNLEIETINYECLLLRPVWMEAEVLKRSRCRRIGHLRSEPSRWFVSRPVRDHTGREQSASANEKCYCCTFRFRMIHTVHSPRHYCTQDWIYWSGTHPDSTQPPPRLALQDAAGKRQRKRYVCEDRYVLKSNLERYRKISFE